MEKINGEKQTSGRYPWCAAPKAYGTAEQVGDPRRLIVDRVLQHMVEMQNLATQGLSATEITKRIGLSEDVVTVVIQEFHLVDRVMDNIASRIAGELTKEEL